MQTSEVVFVWHLNDPSGLGYKDTTFVLTNADFLSHTFPLPQLVRFCGEQAENASGGEDKRTTELAYLLPPAARRRCYFPGLSPVLPASGSWTSPVPYASFPSSSPACTNSDTHWALQWDDLTHKAPTKLLVFFGQLNFLLSYWVASVLTRVCWVPVLVQEWEEYDLPF